MDKTLGVLCHVSSLPNKYGIGDFGECCFDFIDFLAKSKIGVWQILPLSNTNENNCPYGATSSLTFDEQYISPDYLVSLALVDKGELKTLKRLARTHKVKFAVVKSEKLRLLNLAYQNAPQELLEDVTKFANSHPEFYDYGYYRALQKVNGAWDWHEMPRELWEKDSDKYASFAKENEKEILKHIFFQYLLYTQWQKVREHAKAKNVKILGDMPIYPDRTSVDVLFNKNYFKLDENFMPAVTGGVPPDDFCADGQNWGTCVYDWEALKKDGYPWIIKKINVLQSYYDIMRIDHFAGFVEHYEINNEDSSKNAWVKGGGEDLFNKINEKCDIEKIVIEDLGIIKPEHIKICEKFNLTGMSILQSAFDNPNSEYLPKNVKENTIYYLGTHDNNTYLGFLRTIDKDKKQKVLSYLNLPKMSNKKLVIASVKQMLESKSKIVVLQIQDYLMQNEKEKMNTPGQAKGCWEYRVPISYKKTFTRNLKKFLN